MTIQAFDFSKVRKGQPTRPPRILLYGESGIGKTTFASKFKKPFFLCAETGLMERSFEDIDNHTPSNWEELISILHSLKTNNVNKYETIVYDTVDWMEILLNEYVCKKHDKPDIEAFGYGKGYVLAASEWRSMLSMLEALYADGIQIVMLAHSHIKPFNNPSGENYDRYELKCSKQIAAMTKEWVDAVLFAKYAVYLSKSDGAMKKKGFGDNIRVLHSTQCAAFDAKNRLGLPSEMSFDYDTFVSSIGGTDVPEIKKELKKEVELLPESERPAVFSVIKAAGDDHSKLKQVLNKIRQRKESN